MAATPSTKGQKKHQRAYEKQWVTKLTGMVALAEHTLIEGGSPRLSLTENERKTFACVIYDELVVEGVLKPPLV